MRLLFKIYPKWTIHNYHSLIFTTIGPWHLESWSHALAWRLWRPPRHSIWCSDGDWHHSYWWHFFQGECPLVQVLLILGLQVEDQDCNFESLPVRFIFHLHSLLNLRSRILKNLQPRSRLVWGVYWASCWRRSIPTYILILQMSLFPLTTCCIGIYGHNSSSYMVRFNLANLLKHPVYLFIL